MARSTVRRTSALTRGEPLTTRETVARDTPATRATSSRVTPRPFVSIRSVTRLARPLSGLFVAGPGRAVPVGCESALTVSIEPYHTLLRERFHDCEAAASDRRPGAASVPRTPTVTSVARGARECDEPSHFRGQECRRCTPRVPYPTGMALTARIGRSGRSNRLHLHVGRASARLKVARAAEAYGGVGLLPSFGHPGAGLLRITRQSAGSHPAARNPRSAASNSRVRLVELPPSVLPGASGSRPRPRASCWRDPDGPSLPDAGRCRHRSRAPEASERHVGQRHQRVAAQYPGEVQPAGRRPGGGSDLFRVSSATIRPPRCPPCGPRSTIQSAVLITSRLCSMTRTVLPASTRPMRTSSSFADVGEVEARRRLVQDVERAPVARRGSPWPVSDDPLRLRRPTMLCRLAEADR